MFVAPCVVPSAFKKLNTGISLALIAKIAFAVPVPPALLKKGTGMTGWSLSLAKLTLFTCPNWSFTLEPVGKVTPDADNDNSPEPSDEIVAPPIL